jgi:hypothetical protein
LTDAWTITTSPAATPSARKSAASCGRECTSEASRGAGAHRPPIHWSASRTIAAGIS